MSLLLATLRLYSHRAVTRHFEGPSSLKGTHLFPSDGFGILRASVGPENEVILTMPAGEETETLVTKLEYIPIWSHPDTQYDIIKLEMDNGAPCNQLAIYNGDILAVYQYSHRSKTCSCNGCPNTDITPITLIPMTDPIPISDASQAHPLSPFRGRCRGTDGSSEVFVGSHTVIFEPTDKLGDHSHGYRVYPHHIQGEGPRVRAPTPTRTFSKEERPPLYPLIRVSPHPDYVLNNTYDVFWVGPPIGRMPHDASAYVSSCRSVIAGQSIYSNEKYWITVDQWHNNVVRFYEKGVTSHPTTVKACSFVASVDVVLEPSEQLIHIEPLHFKSRQKEILVGISEDRQTHNTYLHILPHPDATDNDVSLKHSLSIDCSNRPGHQCRVSHEDPLDHSANCDRTRPFSRNVPLQPMIWVYNNYSTEVIAVEPSLLTVKQDRWYHVVDRSAWRGLFLVVGLIGLSLLSMRLRVSRFSSFANPIDHSRARELSEHNGGLKNHSMVEVLALKQNAMREIKRDRRQQLRSVTPDSSPEASTCPPSDSRLFGPRSSPLHTDINLTDSQLTALDGRDTMFRQPHANEPTREGPVVLCRGTSLKGKMGRVGQHYEKSQSVPHISSTEPFDERSLYVPIEEQQYRIKPPHHVFSGGEPMRKGSEAHRSARPRTPAKEASKGEVLASGRSDQPRLQQPDSIGVADGNERATDAKDASPVGPTSLRRDESERGVSLPTNHPEQKSQYSLFNPTVESLNFFGSLFFGEK